MSKSVKLKIKITGSIVEIKSDKANSDNIVNAILALKETLKINGISYNRIMADREVEKMVDELNKDLGLI